MSKLGLNRHSAVLLSGFMGMTALAAGSGCDKIAEAQSGLCCSGFEVGGVIDPGSIDADVEFVAFAQAVADFSGTASVMITEVSNACKAMARDLGVEESSVNPPSDPADAAKFWCAEAAGAINASLSAGGSISVEFQPPKCTVNASVQANCEASCSANVECKLTPAEIEARCEGGEVSFKCEGGCSGSCEGSANLAVDCEGTCSGTCQGDCQGTCSAMDGMGNCNGQCEGTCTGECRGTCEVDAGAEVTCQGQCSGGCTGEATAPQCSGEFTPPSAECSGSAQCQGSCDASASAKAECVPPSVEIVASGNVDANLVGALKLHLPNLLMVAKAQFNLMIDNAEAMAQLAISIDPASLSVTAAACLIPIGGSIETAVVNIEASASASLDVFGEVGIN